MSRDDDDLDVQKRPLSGLDGMYANTNIVILIIFSLCCNGLCFLPLILSLIGTLTCRDETAKSNARLSLIISCIGALLTVGGSFFRAMNQPGGGFR
jgi:hypothetical protein